ncbi:MAG: cyclic pyranopterin monophosphate synthase MoaC [Candidatus Bipolaricaulota bacterium]|nr:cyclic pyranopterin monophosphate synthase MoaC [Candidatus Bipolaricaulota bacterium]MBS3791440.1 cyclic pyranopterin monophosphate synthase MoaC [Candidatus Bipolaricaulota bacterium]
MSEEEVRMIDVGNKDDTDREARASGTIVMSGETREKVLAGELTKGNVLSVARTAGIMAAKKTSELLPLCHPLPISNVDIDIEPTDTGFTVEVTVNYQGKTGVEMEALTGCSVALLTIYDMVKSEEKGMEMQDLKLLEKSGGQSGDWKRSS